MLRSKYTMVRDTPSTYQLLRLSSLFVLIYNPSHSVFCHILCLEKRETGGTGGEECDCQCHHSRTDNGKWFITTIMNNRGKRQCSIKNDFNCFHRPVENEW